VPDNRVFVISGSLSKSDTINVSDEVQEWDLNTLTVKKREPMINGGRTSFGCYYHQRYIYVVGGNAINSTTDKSCCRFDIYSRKWQDLPDLYFRRANPCTFVKDNWLYAIGGFEFNGYSQFALNSMEKLDLNNIKAGWKQEYSFNNTDVPQSKLQAKACFYSCDLTPWFQSQEQSDYEPFEDMPEQKPKTDTQVLLVGGWQKSTLCNHIDLWNVDKMTVK
jgi:hypothetical protein